MIHPYRLAAASALLSALTGCGEGKAPSVQNGGAESYADTEFTVEYHATPRRFPDYWVFCDKRTGQRFAVIKCNDGLVSAPLEKLPSAR